MSHFTAVMAKPNADMVSTNLIEPNKPIGLHRENTRSICLVKPGFYLKATVTSQHHGGIWFSENNDSSDGSFIVVFGWCYRIGSNHHCLRESDYIEILKTHRELGQPDVDILSGTYCLISYDHISDSLWFITDMWAQHGFYYASNEKHVVIGSRAAEIADILMEKLDGISYLSRLRGTDFPPGRTLFANVRRATCGQALQLNLKNKTARVVQIQPLYHPPLRLTFEEAVDRFVDVLSRVIPQAADDPSTCVDLTGGNDTRMAAASLAYAQGGKIGKQVTFRVTGSTDHPDVVTAQRVAETLGWTLIRTDRDYPLDYSIESLQKASIISDGKFALPLTLNRLIRETKHWETANGLVGSQGGGLFRGFNWKHELLNMGRTNRINHKAWLKQRLWASNQVDIERVSGDQISLEDHNNALIQPYIAVDQALPNIKNVYKLDRFYHYKKIHSTWCWQISDLRKMILPFHSHEITKVSMTIPWYLKLGRRLITTGIERMEPRLTSISTERGAPMEPLYPGNFTKYINWVVSDVRSNYERHFGKNRFTPIRQYEFMIPPSCLDIILDGSKTRSLYESDSLLKMASHDGINNLTKSHNDEIQALLLVEMILQHYQSIIPELSFDGDGASIGETAYSL